MRLGRQSSNVEDRRGMGGPIMGGGIGVIVIALIAMFFGADPREVIQNVQQGAPAGQGTAGVPTDEEGKVVSAMLADTEESWKKVFREDLGREYQEPTLVLFTGAVQSACGTGQSAMGPFYCPPDQKLYIDLSFYRDLKERFGAPGDFAQAYVIAHEVGHHVQTLLGVSEQVQQERSRVSQAEGNALSVRQELQADCFAGVWAFHGQKDRQILEAGDVEEAINAASAIGDDRIQRETQGRIQPESFTHGTSAQRVEWFRRGLETGDIRQCDTFQ